jgi:hypothetical protein
MLRKIIKRIFQFVLVTVTLLILGIISIPIFFKDQIKAKVLKEIDKKINADVNFTDLTISSFKNFPHITLTLHNACVTGVEDFKGDTLVSAKEIGISFDLWSVMKGNNFEINSIHLEHPLVYARILENGKENYNIVKQDTAKNKGPSQSAFDINIGKWAINDGRIIYDDKLQKTYIEVGGLYHSGSGDFKEEISDLDIVTRVSDLTLMYNGIQYFKKKLFEVDLVMEMNLKEKKFTFKDHTFKLGHFKFGFDGYFQLLENGYKTDMTFIVKETSFKNLLSLLPGVYQKDMEGINTKGEFSCTGFLRGIYDVKDNKTPAYNIDLKVTDAMFKYSHLPKAVEKISFHLVANNPDGYPEHSTFDLKTFHFEIDKNPVHGRVFVKGVKDIHVNADIKLMANLAEIEKIYPINGLVLKGILNSEIKIDGRYNEAQKLFPNVDAFITLEKGYVKSKDSPLSLDSLHISAELLNSTGKISDTRINLNNMTFLLDEEPFVMSGTISDLIDYNYNLKIDGLVDLDKLTQIYPAASTTLSGTLNFDITTDGSLAEIEAKKYNLLKTSGTLEVKNLSYKNKDINVPVHIDDALFSFTPDKIILDKFKAEFGKSNITLSGHLYNYIPYLLKNSAPIKGDLTMHCDTLDMDEWFPSSVSDKGTAKNDSLKTKQGPMEVLVIPANIDFTIDSDIKMLEFGKMDITSLTGEIKIKNGVLTLNETGFNTMDSKFVLSGDYDTRDNKHPLFDLDIDIDKLDIARAYKMFIDEKEPSSAQGLFSTKYSLKGELTPDFTPIHSTLSGKGKITIDNVSVKGMKLFSHIKNISKKDEFQNPELNDIVMDTEIKDEKIMISPFTFKVRKFSVAVEGAQGFDNTMEYFIKLSIPPFHKLRIPMSIKGNSDKPVIKLGQGFNHEDFEKL